MIFTTQYAFADSTVTPAPTTAGTSAPVAAPVPPPQPSALGSMLPFLLMALVFYFLMIRPQQRRMKTLQASITESLNQKATRAEMMQSQREAARIGEEPDDREVPAGQVPEQQRRQAGHRDQPAAAQIRERHRSDGGQDRRGRRTGAERQGGEGMGLHEAQWARWR